MWITVWFPQVRSIPSVFCKTQFTDIISLFPHKHPTTQCITYSCPSSWWCHPTISSPVAPFSSCLQSFPVSGSFPRGQFFTSGGQSIGVSASASVLPMNILKVHPTICSSCSSSHCWKFFPSFPCWWDKDKFKTTCYLPCTCNSLCLEHIFFFSSPS